MKDDGKDKYDIKRFEEIFKESQMMIPDSQSRFKKTLEDLSTFLKNTEMKLDPNGQWMVVAKEILSKNSIISAADDDVTETPLDNLKEGDTF
eukprot:CAMPEP_0184861218 /NCGR_PEP_ID=MMETSP0580-20130426/5967_1 /TAXON_ID=1118495 /ORGANISM="Dactyliosolen fragilissimus" /LENGTH=91 /DNA_ID=CAMNT_0027358639 /DNA_START=104 /DNA_END=382 /DNA_ORIENTATION=+